MPKLTYWKVRIYLPGPTNSIDAARHTGLQQWVREIFRYAGVVDPDRDDDGSVWVFDLNPSYRHSKTSSRSWAERNAERIQSFGIEARPVPEPTRFDRDARRGRYCDECGAPRPNTPAACWNCTKEKRRRRTKRRS